jgi:hypothetical protein
MEKRKKSNTHDVKQEEESTLVSAKKDEIMNSSFNTTPNDRIPKTFAIRFSKVLLSSGWRAFLFVQKDPSTNHRGTAERI